MPNEIKSEKSPIRKRVNIINELLNSGGLNPDVNEPNPDPKQDPTLQSFFFFLDF